MFEKAIITTFPLVILFGNGNELERLQKVFQLYSSGMYRRAEISPTTSRSTGWHRNGRREARGLISIDALKFLNSF